MERASRGSWRRLTVVVCLILGLVGCTQSPSNPDAPPTPDGATVLANQLAAALAAGSIESLPLTGDPARAVLDHQQITGSMGGLWPSVSVGAVNHYDQGDSAGVQLIQNYHFAQGDWTFNSAATLRHSEQGWQVEWSPTIVHPELDATSRLYHERVVAKRGPIIDAGGAAIVTDRPVYRIGIDKTKVDAEWTDASARALAGLVGIDAEPYAQLVAASGTQAFVLAITLRDGQVPAGIDQIPGAIAIGTYLPLAPSATFARGLLGIAGEATAEVIEAAGGQIKQGDIVGLSGLQKTHDEQLRGLPGHTITIIKRSESQLAELPPPTPSPDAATASASPRPPNLLLHSAPPVNGEPVQLTMELALQQRAEDVLAGYQQLVMVVVLDRQTGGILAAANSPVAGSQSFVTTGRYPPGSTMKVVTSLALLRRGYTPDTPVNCSPTAEVNGRVFTNYPGYPAAHTGQISLRTALQQSCNTAFMNASRDFGPTELADAAASLGIGVDFETGFAAFYGAVPASDDPVVRAAATIGQGNLAMSPMAMAAEAASAGSGHTVVPYLVVGQQPTPTAKPLTETEAAMLREMMASVVDGGTLLGLRGVLEGGKSGTAEYTDDVPPKAHGWTVGYVGRYAICVLDHDNLGTVSQDVIRAMLA